MINYCKIVSSLWISFSASQVSLHSLGLRILNLTAELYIVQYVVLYWFNVPKRLITKYIFSGCLLIIQICPHFHVSKCGIHNGGSASEFHQTCWGSPSRAEWERVAREKVIQRERKRGKRRGAALRRICYKSTLGPQPLYHPPQWRAAVHCLERAEATHHLSGSENRRARTLQTLMLSKQSKEYNRVLI